MRIEIHEAHWQAIQERQRILQQMIAQFQLLRNEDKRHVDAVMLAAGHNPNDYQNYEMTTENGVFYLDVTSKPQPVPQAA